jgi:UDP-glucose 4-epimerase
MMASGGISQKSSSSSLESVFDRSSSGTDSDGAYESASVPRPERGDEQYVLVTGGLGYIGSHTCLELLKSGYNVLIVEDLSNSYPHIFLQILAVARDYHTARQTVLPRAILSVTDYGDVPAMGALLDAYASGPAGAAQNGSRIIGVIHFAAFKQVEESICDPLKYYENNIARLLGLLRLLGEFNIKTFIFSSSASVYGSQAGAGQLLREEDCLHEQEVTDFSAGNGLPPHHKSTFSTITNAYGRTKLFGEAILADLVRSDLSWKIVALRYFNPIGGDASGLLGEEPKTPSTTLPAALSGVMTGQSEKAYIYGNDWDSHDGTPVRDFIHVTDLARGHIAALEAAIQGRVKESFRTFNLGTGSGHSVLDLIKTLEGVSRRSIPCDVVGRRLGDVVSSVANTERSAQELGWQTELTLEDACSDLCNYLENRNSSCGCS